MSFKMTGDGVWDKTLFAPLANWTLFKQLLDESLPGPRRSDDGRTWRVLFTRPDPQFKILYFALSVRFPQKLPEPGEWPTLAQLKKP
jgi:hypothetical protein